MHHIIVTRAGHWACVPEMFLSLVSVHIFNIQIALQKNFTFCQFSLFSVFLFSVTLHPILYVKPLYRGNGSACAVVKRLEAWLFNKLQKIFSNTPTANSTVGWRLHKGYSNLTLVKRFPWFSFSNGEELLFNKIKFINFWPAIWGTFLYVLLLQC